MRNPGLDEAQAGIKIVGRNINNLRYADDTTLTAESEEELKNLLMRMEEESEKVGLKLNIQKPKIMISGPICCCFCWVALVVSDSAQPHRWQPTRLPHPWDSAGTSWQIDGETVETVADFIFGGSKIIAVGHCSHEIKRRLLLGRKVMINLESILKIREITLPTKVHLVKAVVFQEVT